VNWCCEFIGQPLKDIQVDHEDIEKRAFSANVASLSRRTTPQKQGPTRQKVRQYLALPAQYFVERGFHPKVLDRYDVGVCHHPSSQMFNRAVAPIYDDNHRFMVGCTGRSIFPECKKCKHYHSPDL